MGVVLPFAPGAFRVDHHDLLRETTVSLTQSLEDLLGVMSVNLWLDPDLRSAMMNVLPPHIERLRLLAETLRPTCLREGSSPDGRDNVPASSAGNRLAR